MTFQSVSTRVCLAFALVLGGCVHQARAMPAGRSEAPVIAPEPAWVARTAPPAVSTAPATAPVRVLLDDLQVFFGADADEVYEQKLLQIATPEGLAIGNLQFGWNPETDWLSMHHVRILRGATVIDVLAGGNPFTVLRRETNLDRAVLDGTLTATLQLEGLQVGDVVDIALTIRRHDPSLAGRSELINTLGGLKLDRVHLRYLWSATKAMRWRVTSDLPNLKRVETSAGGEMSLDLQDFAPQQPPEGAPARFSAIGQLQFSQFADWAELASTMEPLYAKAATFGPASALATEADRIAALSSDPKIRATAALKLVQERVRYLYLGMNLGNYSPAEADLTWTRRFGDCKAKTVVLLALLRALGVEAEPALVSTVAGDGLDNRLPAMEDFNHVLVRAHIAGRTYWLDGTRIGDLDLDGIQTPDFGWALPLLPAGATLVKLTTPPLTEPAAESRLQLDARAGLDKPAPAHAQALFRGDQAVAMHQALSALARPEAERFQRAFWKSRYDWIDPSAVAFTFDAQARIATLRLDGAARMDWSQNDGVRDFDIQDSSLGWGLSYRREPGPHQDAPFQVDYPMFKIWDVSIQLPGKGVGFSLFGEKDVATTAAGVAFTRSTTFQDGLVSMHASERSLVPEFPAAEAEAASKTLRDLYRYDVVVRAGAAYRATLTSEPAGGGAPVEIAAGYAAKATGHLRKGEYDAAIKDLDEAVRLEPASSTWRYNRGVARFQNGQDDLAAIDFSEALRLKPDDILALLARGEVYLDLGDAARAKSDFDRAMLLAPASTPIVVRAAAAYERAGRFDSAIHFYDNLTQHPGAGVQPVAVLAQGCRLRAEWGRSSVQGRADCEAALALDARQVPALQGRALFNYRERHFDRAIADWDLSLKVEPDAAYSLYGRGLSERAVGRTREAASDLAAAKAGDPQIETQFQAFHLDP